jgi:HSP20 family protein
MVEKSHITGWRPDLYQPLRNISQRVADWFAPRSDASVLEDYYEINVELPGVKSEDVTVSIEGNSLVVRGANQYEHEEAGRTYFFSEREYGSFQRTFRLPPDADTDKIDAEFSDGILRLKIAKRASGRRIEVRKA